jgi:hypothetical protein
MAQNKKHTEPETTPFIGGMNTFNEPGLLPTGSYSSVNNLRQMYPGLKQRMGYIKKHSTADGTNGVMSMYQFSKGKRTERHFYAQMTDSDVLEATDAPPAVTTGVFGSEVFSGSSSPIPGSWSTFNDFCIFSNGVDQHQICAGDANSVDKFIVYDSDTQLTGIPSIGADYTEEVNDTSAPTVAVLDSLGALNWMDTTNYRTIKVSGTASGTDLTLSSSGGVDFTEGLTVGNKIRIYASGVFTITSGQYAQNNETVTIGNKVYTYKTTLTPAEGEVLIGANANASALNLYRAITHGDGNGSLYQCAAAHTQVTAYNSGTNAAVYVWSLTSGAASNTIETTETGTYLAFASATLTGGAEDNTIASVTSATTATVVTAWSASFSGGMIQTSHDCLLLCAPVTPNKITFTVSSANANTSTMSIYYYSTTGWKSLTITDGTSSSSKTLAQTGSVTWTTPTDAVPYYMYETNGMWLKISFSAELDSEVEISQVTYGSGFANLSDMWDGVLVDAVEAYHYVSATASYTKNSFLGLERLYLPASTGGSSTGPIAPIQQRKSGGNTNQYYVYGTSDISIGGMTSSNHVYFNSPDPIVGFYIDVGSTPNTTATTTINAVQYLPPSGTWTTVGSFTDGTSGISKSGFVMFTRQSDIRPNTFQGSPYSSYWYRFTVDKTLSATISIGIQVIPYFDITAYGMGICNAAWDNRMVYVFDKNPSWIVLSAQNQPQVLSSSDSAMFAMGDGRSNKVVCMKPFHDALLIAQEEKGASGGCLTILQKPAETGIVGETTVVSSRYGCMNSQSMEVIEHIEGGHRAYILSREGILFTDGKGVNFVKGFEKIKNYFDPSSSTCIRTGYESKMYLKFDSQFKVLKIGLTTGSSATNNNVFLVYDLLLGEFMADTYANNFACECECDSASGNIPTTRLAGGQADGTVYVLNSGTNDITTAVNSYVTLEINANGKIIRNGEMIARFKTQTGNATIGVYYNGVEQTSLAKTLSLTAEHTNDRIRRHRINLNQVNQNISVKLSHNTADESFYPLDYGLRIEEYVEQ